MIPRVVLTSSLLLLLTLHVAAQNRADITTDRWIRGDAHAMITLYVSCEDVVAYDVARSDLVITVDGEVVEDASVVDTPSPLKLDPISVALVCDVSGSMGAGTPSRLDEMKKAGHAFVDIMDGVIDEAALIMFNDRVTVYQQMTTNKPMLHAAVDALYASGATAMWDAAYTGVEHIANNAVNPKRAVVLMTDGMDNSSVQDDASVINLALQLGIRVFIVGLGDALNHAQLQAVASRTGGRYFNTPDASELQQIYTNIATFIKRGYDEYTVIYRNPDPDAMSQTLLITVRSCNQTLQAERTITAFNTLTAGQPSAAQPFSLQLQGNVPNPVTTHTTIQFSLEGAMQAQPVRLEVHDILGRKVATLLDAFIPSGTYTVPFTTTTLMRGMYVIRLHSGSVMRTRCMIIQR
jgi:hypothetical protein